MKHERDSDSGATYSRSAEMSQPAWGLEGSWECPPSPASATKQAYYYYYREGETTALRLLLHLVSSTSSPLQGGHKGVDHLQV